MLDFIEMITFAIDPIMLSILQCKFKTRQLFVLVVSGTAWIGPLFFVSVFGSVPYALLNLTAVLWVVKLSYNITTILLEFNGLDTVEYKRDDTWFLMNDSYILSMAVMKCTASLGSVFTLLRWRDPYLCMQSAADRAIGLRLRNHVTHLVAF